VKDLEVQILSGVGHFPQLVAPERLNPLMNAFFARAR
jgi:pimeloyl-ACP methyl ester carboxylesterase